MSKFETIEIVKFLKTRQKGKNHRFLYEFISKKCMACGINVIPAPKYVTDQSSLWKLDLWFPWTSSNSCQHCPAFAAKLICEMMFIRMGIDWISVCARSTCDESRGTDIYARLQSEPNSRSMRNSQNYNWLYRKLEPWLTYGIVFYVYWMATNEKLPNSMERNRRYVLSLCQSRIRRITVLQNWYKEHMLVGRFSRFDY